MTPTTNRIAEVEVAMVARAGPNAPQHANAFTNAFAVYEPTAGTARSRTSAPITCTQLNIFPSFLHNSFYKWSLAPIQSFIVLSLSFLTSLVSMSKRTRETDDGGSPGRPQRRTTSPASKFNARVLRKLQKEIDANPKVDLISKFPMDYSKRLTEAKGHRECEKSQHTSYPHRQIYSQCQTSSLPQPTYQSPIPIQTSRATAMPIL